MKNNDKNDSIGCGLAILGLCIGLTFATEFFVPLLAVAFLIIIINND